ncbi:unnamed protein product [Clavelina lepadiformis]|uniref:Uncharacterized protein n=1 Tax=Clavelina lepadiformis TaxID=159417 RepID=A0ABP0GT82_CLALP
MPILVSLRGTSAPTSVMQVYPGNSEIKISARFPSKAWMMDVAVMEGEKVKMRALQE